jgi:predicted dehydrogenase
MLSEEALDGVLIATPHNQHADQVRAALERSLPVLVEKPLALAPQEAEDLASLASNRHVCLLVAFNPPYWRHTRALREGIAAGRIGKLESVQLSWSGSAEAVFGRAPMPDAMPGVVKPTLFRADPLANGGGFLMDAGGHLLSELLFVTGLPVRRVTAVMDRVPDDMRAALSLQLEGGALATVLLVGDSARPERIVRSVYTGSRGSVMVSGLPFAITWESDGKTERIEEAGLPSSPTPVSDWLNSILSGAPAEGSASHAAEITRLLAGAYRAAGADEL